MDYDSESKLISLISQLVSLHVEELDTDLFPISLIVQTISLVRYMDMDSQPKPKSKLMSLIEQTISLFKSMDLDSQPKPLSELISLISQLINDVNSDLESKFEELVSLIDQTWSLEPEPEFKPFIRQILSLATSMSSKWKKLISLSPQVEVVFERGIRVIKKIPLRSNYTWGCTFPPTWEKFSLAGEDDTHFLCLGCKGVNHKEYEQAPLEVRHLLHPKHSLQLVSSEGKSMDCYCCDKHPYDVYYYCSACDFVLDIACVEKQPDLSINHPRWHEHPLALFPSQASLPCNLCALTHSSCPFYICPPCDFVVHQRCISLPHVIRISRHLHRIHFTPSFEERNWSCSICRRKINNDYGGYSCIKDGCSYGAHSKCATQSNVWDGKELEGEPEEIEEVVPPFTTIGKGIIQHFSHDHHHLRLDEDTGRDYDEDKQCQACMAPIYFGNFYSCMQCDFILHETCANLPRKMYHPIHPHLLTLVRKNESVMGSGNTCWACGDSFMVGFYYECGERGCYFKIQVQCATISEPLVNGSHRHPLFLTSKPGEKRECSVCKKWQYYYSNETFNCIECGDFALCFECAIIPQRVRYKHDKHILTLSYGEETSTMAYWCEVCEKKIEPKEGFYTCDEYCCVTLHIKCVIGKDRYMKPGSSFLLNAKKVSVMPNNHHMSRPICSSCKKRCPHKVFLKLPGSIIACSVYCGIS